MNNVDVEAVFSILMLILCVITSKITEKVESVSITFSSSQLKWVSSL